MTFIFISNFSVLFIYVLTELSHHTFYINTQTLRAYGLYQAPQEII